MSISRQQPSFAVTREDRENRSGHKGFVVWFTGLSGAGKSTLANHVEKALHEKGHRTFLLDGDDVRRGLCADLGFTDADRYENLRRVGEVCRLFVESGMIVLASFISPSHAGRNMVRTLVGADDFVEVYCDAPLSVCEQRDIKGLYARARKGEITHFTGISSPYEVPENPDIVMHTGAQDVGRSVAQVMEYLADSLGRARLP